MKQVTYSSIFWLFMFGNILGVIIEGVWCKLRYGKWETHTVALWGPFNIVYGIGVPMFYISSILLNGIHWLAKFFSFSLIGSLVEYLCGLAIRIGVRMKAWDYRKQFMNIQGLISPKMTIVWGIVGFGFYKILFNPLKKLLLIMNGTVFDIACMGLTAFMAINLLLTAICIIRWSNRHYGKPSVSRLTRWVDKNYPDEKMQKKFFYWSFID